MQITFGHHCRHHLSTCKLIWLTHRLSHLCQYIVCIYDAPNSYRIHIYTNIAASIKSTTSDKIVCSNITKYPISACIIIIIRINIWYRHLYVYGTHKPPTTYTFISYHVDDYAAVSLTYICIYVGIYIAFHCTWCYVMY